jgi:hypothetical protein
MLDIENEKAIGGGFGLAAPLELCEPEEAI